MILEWDVPMVADYPEDDLTDIIKSVQEHGWDEEKVIAYINDTVSGFEDCVYYNWSNEQTMEVVNEIKQRLGGVQLSMFDEEVSEN
jgi:asparagine synthetase A